MTEGTVQADEGVDLFYRAAGEGPAVTLIPNGFHLERDFQPLASGRRLVFYDVRNRGRSSAVADESKLTRGIHNDVGDLDIVRRRFGVDRVDLIGHSYTAVAVLLYAMTHASSVRRVIAIGPMGPRPATQYAPPLSYADNVTQSVLSRLSALEKEREDLSPLEFCEKFWSILREIYVADPADAAKIEWSRCHLTNERASRAYWGRYVLPSLNALSLTRDDLVTITAPVLVVHGTRDRSAPFGGGRDWALELPNARLLAVDGAGHAPWIEAPAMVLGALRTFLDGDWPAGASSSTVATLTS